MKSFSGSLSAAGLALTLALAAAPAGAGAEAGAPALGQQGIPLKPASPASVAAAKEILTMKNAGAMFANAVPNIVEQTKNALIQNNLNYQKDLNEVAVDRRQDPVLAAKRRSPTAWRRSTPTSSPSRN